MGLSRDIAGSPSLAGVVEIGTKSTYYLRDCLLDDQECLSKVLCCFFLDTRGRMQKTLQLQ